MSYKEKYLKYKTKYFLLKEQLGGVHENSAYLQPQTIVNISEADNSNMHQEYIISYYTHYEKALIEYYYNNLSRDQLLRVLNFFKKYFLLRVCLNKYKLLGNNIITNRAELLRILNLNDLPLSDADISNIANNRLDNGELVDDFFRHKYALDDIEFRSHSYSQTPLEKMFSKIEQFVATRPKPTGLQPTLITINEFILLDLGTVDSRMHSFRFESKPLTEQGGRFSQAKSLIEQGERFYKGNRLTSDDYHKKYLPDEIRNVLTRNGIQNLNEDIISLFKRYYLDTIDQKFIRIKIKEEFQHLSVQLSQLHPAGLPARQTTPTFTANLEILEPDYFSNWVENIRRLAISYGVI